MRGFWCSYWPSGQGPAARRRRRRPAAPAAAARRWTVAWRGALKAAAERGSAAPWAEARAARPEALQPAALLLAAAAAATGVVTARRGPRARVRRRTTPGRKRVAPTGHS